MKAYTSKKLTATSFGALVNLYSINIFFLKATKFRYDTIEKVCAITCFPYMYMAIRLMYEPLPRIKGRVGEGGREGGGGRGIETMAAREGLTLLFMDVVLGCKQLRDLSLLISVVNFSTGSCISVVVNNIV